MSRHSPMLRLSPQDVGVLNQQHAKATAELQLRGATTTAAAQIVNVDSLAQPVEGHEHHRHAQCFLKRKAGTPVKSFSVNRPDEFARERSDSAAPL